MYSVNFASSARKALKKLPKEILEKIIRKIEDLISNPYSPHLDVKKLAGGGGEHRLRVGDYRIVYLIEDDRLLILIVAIAHRKDVYK